MIHAVATGGEIGATVLAFALIGWGLRRGCLSTRYSGQTATSMRTLGNVTLALGALWLLLTIVTGASYLSHGVDEVKGAFQRVDQVVFGVWLLLLARAADQEPEDSGAG